MTEQGFNEAPSRRYIRAYLAIWAILGIIGLSYLASLVLQPEHLTTTEAQPTQPVQPAQKIPQTQTAKAVPPVKAPQPDPGLEIANKALVEIGAMRLNVDDLQKHVGELKEAVEQRVDGEKSLQSRVAALEEKVATLPTAPVATSTAPTAPVKPKVAEKAQPKVTPAKAPPQPKPTPRVIPVPQEPTNEITTTIPLETGSITTPVFGEVVVTRSGDLFAVQLDVAPSVDVPRSRWGILVERYGSTLATLQPRYLPPRTPGAPYRLIAGPIASVADAKEICGELRAQLPTCSTIDFGGEPL
jgi:hypothetical protein